MKFFHLLRFLGTNFCGDMFKGFLSRGPIVVDLLDNQVMASVTH